MTEPICENCGKPLSTCQCDEPKVSVSKAREPDRLVRIESVQVPSQEEFEKVKKQKEEYERIIGLQAEKDFRNELDEFLSQVDNEDKKAQIRAMIDNDPDRLENAKMMTSILEQAIMAGGGRVTGRRAPSGKASLATNNSGISDDFKTYVDTLYATLRDPTKSDLEKESTNQMLDQLFGEMVKGLRVAKGKYGHATESYQVMECPNCRLLLTGQSGAEIDYCPSCGWQKYVKGARRA
jgi:hypothetical protein